MGGDLRKRKSVSDGNNKGEISVGREGKGLTGRKGAQKKGTTPW